MSLKTSTTWNAPDRPDPSAILHEAQADTSAGRHEVALAKHVWFHRNALKYERALYGVRLSFALMYWNELAIKYPPAMAELKKLRDEARTLAIQSKREAREAFHDFAAINRTLKEEFETKSLFVLLDEMNAPVARQVYEIALPSLLSAKDYRLCGKYIDPQSSFANNVVKFKEMIKIQSERHRHFAESTFTNEMETLVALLVLNNRKIEAAEVASKAKKEYNNEAFNTALELALTGIVPEPWP